MILEFKKEDFKKGYEKIVIAVPVRVYRGLLEKIEVRSPFTGNVKTFIYSRAESEKYAMECEFWDGEESHSLYVEDSPNPMPIMIDVVSSNYE